MVCTIIQPGILYYLLHFSVLSATFSSASLEKMTLMDQRYLTTNLYVFYEVANLYEFVWPHSYDFVRFV